MKRLIVTVSDKTATEHGELVGLANRQAGYLSSLPLFAPLALNGNPALRGSGYRRSVPVHTGLEKR